MIARSGQEGLSLTMCQVPGLNPVISFMPHFKPTKSFREGSPVQSPVLQVRKPRKRSVHVPKAICDLKAVEVRACPPNYLAMADFILMKNSPSYGILD